MSRCSAAVAAICIAAVGFPGVCEAAAAACGEDDDVCLLQARVQEQARLERTIARDMRRHGLGRSEAERASTAAQVSRLLFNMQGALASMSSSAAAQRVMTSAAARLDAVGHATRSLGSEPTTRQEDAEIIASKLQKAAPPLLDVFQTFLEHGRHSLPPQLRELAPLLDGERARMATTEFSEHFLSNMAHAAKDVLEDGPVRERLQRELDAGARVVRDLALGPSSSGGEGLPPVGSLLQTDAADGRRAEAPGDRRKKYDAAKTKASEGSMVPGTRTTVVRKKETGPDPKDPNTEDISKPFAVGAEWEGGLREQHESHVTSGVGEAFTGLSLESGSRLRDDLQAIQKGREQLEYYEPRTRPDADGENRSMEYLYTEPLVKDRMAAVVKRYIDCMDGLQYNCKEEVACDVYLNLEDLSKAFKICGVHLKTLTRSSVYVLSDENYAGTMKMGYSLGLKWTFRTTAVSLSYTPLSFGWMSCAVDNSRLGQGDYELRPGNAMVVNIFNSRKKMFETRSMGPSASASFGGGHPVAARGSINYGYGYSWCPKRSDSYSLKFGAGTPTYRDILVGSQGIKFTLAYASTRLSSGKHDSFSISFGRSWAQVWAHGDNIQNADKVGDSIGLSVAQKYGEYWEGFAGRRGFSISAGMGRKAGTPDAYFKLGGAGLGYSAPDTKEMNSAPFEACNNHSIPWGSGDLTSKSSTVWGNKDAGWVTHDYNTVMFFEIMMDLKSTGITSVPLGKRDMRKTVGDLEQIALVKMERDGAWNRELVEAAKTEDLIKHGKLDADVVRLRTQREAEAEKAREKDSKRTKED